VLVDLDRPSNTGDSPASLRTTSLTGSSPTLKAIGIVEVGRAA
jgi:hypothetical protein